MTDELEEMKQKLEEVKKKYEEALKVDEEFKQKVATNPDIIRLDAQSRELSAQSLDLREQREAIIKNVNLMFTTDGRYPTFAHKSQKYPQYTNIKQEVLDMIVQDVGKLYMLRKEDIITIVDNMIHIELAKHPEVVTFENMMDEIVLKRNKIDSDIYNLRKTITQGWDSTSYDLKTQMQQLERNINEYAKDESRAKRDEKIDQVRNKAREFKTAEAIYKKIKGAQ